MPEHETRARAVYDHDNDEPRPVGRRRRQVSDWGVGEELFDHMPGPRFERRPHAEIRRGDVGDGRRTIAIDTGDAKLAHETPPPAQEEFASRDEALRARKRHDELWAGDEPFADARRRKPAAADRWAAAEAWAAGAELATSGADDVEPLAEGPVERQPDGIARGGQPGRRTVKIGGRPAEFYGSPARARRRPPRPVHERLGPRPERIAAWAFALGLLLILIAVATANAAVSV
jgi:hypothetical protein